MIGSARCDVVLCEGDVAARGLLVRVLSERGYVTTATASVEVAAEQCSCVEFPPVLVTDAERLEALAKPGPPTIPRETPVLALVEPESALRTLEAFHAGADAVLPTPVDTALLVAQVNALATRHPARRRCLTFGGFSIDLTAEVVRHDGREVCLTAKEFSLLTRLAQDLGTVVSKRQLAQAGWGEGHVAPNTLAVHISSLRRKLARFGPCTVHTVHGRGYRLDPP